MAGIFLGMVLNFFIILVVLNGGTNVDGKLKDNNIVNSIGKGGKAVEDCNFVGHERWAGVVN